MTHGTLIAAACLLAGGWATFKSLRALVRGALSRSWPAARGVIETVTVEKTSGTLLLALGSTD